MSRSTNGNFFALRGARFRLGRYRWRQKPRAQRAERSTKIQSRSKFSISIEIFNLALKFQSRGLDFPTKNRAAVGGSLENFILARNFQSLGKNQRVKTQRVKISENFAEEKMLAEDNSENFSEDRRYHFYWIL